MAPPGAPLHLGAPITRGCHDTLRTPTHGSLRWRGTHVAHVCAHALMHAGIPCCGMAGDRGMRYPELARAATQHLDVPAGACCS